MFMSTDWLRLEITTGCQNTKQFIEMLRGLLEAHSEILVGRE